MLTILELEDYLYKHEPPLTNTEEMALYCICSCHEGKLIDYVTTGYLIFTLKITPKKLEKLMQGLKDKGFVTSKIVNDITHYYITIKV